MADVFPAEASSQPLGILSPCVYLSPTLLPRIKIEAPRCWSPRPQAKHLAGGPKVKQQFQGQAMSGCAP